MLTGQTQLDLQLPMSDPENGEISNHLDNCSITQLGLQVLESRCLLKDDNLKIAETPSGLFHRVARLVSSADLNYDESANVEKTEDEFCRVMSNLEFLPNSPALMNAGTPIGQLAACFVLPIRDSIKSIYTALRYAAIIHQSGGGTGFDFSKIRPEGDIVRSTKGVASGPVSFIRIFNESTNIIKDGGKRRGANMGILRIDHPDILKFVRAKSDEGEFTNFNFSVAIPDSFIKAVRSCKNFPLRNPRTGKVEEVVDARWLFDEIVRQAWSTGEPGIIFIDEINRKNLIPDLGRIEATNTCGEQPLLPYESCVLGSINLSKIVVNNTLSWKKLESLARIAVHFLDNVIDVTNYPLPKIAKITRSNRKIGIGVMGFADMLIKLKIPYKSNAALSIAEKVMRRISEKTRDESTKIAQIRGSFHSFSGSIWKKNGYEQMRNATLTTIAPTGTISIIAGCTNSIEPIFSIATYRNIIGHLKALGVNKLFAEEARKRGIYTEELIRKITKSGSVQTIRDVPEELKKTFVTALDIEPEWHIRMQATFQQYTDNAVAKTVNLPYEATVDDVKRIFMFAHTLRCKGITVYRNGSRKSQVLYNGSQNITKCSC